jgi:diketogulonate reductase-like aldo/keto reductase
MDAYLFSALTNQTPPVFQIEYHAYLLGSTRETVEFCVEKGIVVAAYGGLSPIIRSQDDDESLRAVLAKLASSQKYTDAGGITEGQLLIKWLHAKGMVAVT